MVGRFGRVAIGAVVGAVLVTAPLAINAQDAPSYATSATETIHGNVASITGRYTLTVSDERGFVDSVTMHDGTVIEPSGVSLEVGQDVTIIGRTDGKTFDANEVDTDGADDSQSYDTGPAGDSYDGPYLAGVYPAYVVPIGGGNYYYGNSSGGYYYNSGSGYGSGYPSHPHAGGGSGTAGSSSSGGHGYGPVVGPITRGRGLPPRTSSGGSAPRGSGTGRASGSSHH